MTSGRVVERFSIWWAIFPFADGIGKKKRPVIVVGTRGDKLSCLYITRQGPKSDNDFLIEHWEEAGLNERSYIRTDRGMEYDNDELLEYIGQLHSNDELLLKIRYSII
jgi:hypothetical protein